MKEIPEINIWELCLLLLRKRKRLRVAGNSMLPILKPGEEILISPQAYKKFAPNIGDIVVALHPQQNFPIVKRVASIDKEGSCYLVGDNIAESSSSGSFGTIPVKDILGKVICRFD